MAHLWLLNLIFIHFVDYIYVLHLYIYAFVNDATCFRFYKFQFDFKPILSAVRMTIDRSFRSNKENGPQYGGLEPGFEKPIVLKTHLWFLNLPIVSFCHNAEVLSQILRSPLSKWYIYSSSIQRLLRCFDNDRF